MLAPPGSVLKTPSGKIRRAATRDRYEGGGFARRVPAMQWQAARFVASVAAPRLRSLGRTVRSLASAGLTWAVVVTVGTPVWVAVVTLPTLRLRWRIVRSAGRVLEIVAGVRLQLTGAPPELVGAYVVVANHMSFLDGLALIESFPLPLCLIAGDELAGQRIVGPFLRRLGCEFVNREALEKEVASARKLTEVLRSGRPIAVFPEGGLDRAVGVRPFHLGAFGAATEVGVPVLPVGIRGSRDVLRPGRRFPRRGQIEVAIGEAIAPRSAGWEATLQLSEDARAAICLLSGEPAIG